jgi:hypothetical protein
MTLEVRSPPELLPLKGSHIPLGNASSLGNPVVPFSFSGELAVLDKG